MFSSDRGTAHLLGEALNELGMQVEHCPEIFGAVERLTLQSFDVLVVDWEDEPEASFLLKAARELKSNEPPFPVAVVEAETCVQEALRAGANQVLTRSEARNGLFQFHDRTRSHDLAVFNDVEIAASGAPEDDVAELGALGKRKFADTAYLSDSPPENLSLSFAGYASRVGKRWPASRKRWASVGESRHAYKRALAFLMLVVAIFLSVTRLGPVLHPDFPALHAAAIFATVQAAHTRVSEKLTRWLNPREEDLSEASLAEQIFVEPSRVHKRAAGLKASHSAAIPEIADPTDDPVATAAPEPQTPPSPPATVAENISPRIPESLKHPPEALSVRTVVANLTPTLLGALEPVLIPEEVSRKMLLQKVQPSYPEQALRAGLQGPVVLQAWIGRDGRIRDLKLVRGYLVLGRAAFDAVKQWRYQPYYRNGQAMETQTYITVNFTPTIQAERNQ